MSEEKKYHCICHGIPERTRIAKRIGCRFDDIHVIRNEADVKKLPDGATVYNINCSMEEALLADFCRKRENLDVMMWSISEEDWVKS